MKPQKTNKVSGYGDAHLEKIRSVLMNPREPARMWSWPDPELTSVEKKRVAERSVAKEFCAAFQAKEGKRIFKSLKTWSSDPPDVVAVMLNGGSVGIEVTELIDPEHQRQTVKAWRKFSAGLAPRFWKIEEVVAGIQKRVRDKHNPHSPEFSGGPYCERVLVIYSVEVFIDSGFERYAALIDKEGFGPAHRYDSVYFMVPPAVSHGSVDTVSPHARLCKLNLKRGR